MSKRNLTALLAGLAIVGVGIGCSSGDAGAGTTGGTEGGGGTTGGATAMATATDVMDVINQNCMPCHAGAEAKSKLNLESIEGLMKGNEDGPVVVAGDAANSKIVKAIKGEAGTKRMPPAPKSPLSDADVKKIEDWINAGAKTS